MVEDARGGETKTAAARSRAKLAYYSISSGSIVPFRARIERHDRPFCGSIQSVLGAGLESINPVDILSVVVARSWPRRRLRACPRQLNPPMLAQSCAAQMSVLRCSTNMELMVRNFVGETCGPRRGPLGT